MAAIEVIASIAAFLGMMALAVLAIYMAGYLVLFAVAAVSALRGEMGGQRPKKRE